ncbi:hypothetical protein SIM91_43420 [Rhodococcus opacus]|uniref:hypothetical protein n=1 Tax=Rhodococcus opacus TaxID=37919 RepID=UPI0002A2534D|nr:hypothetical protein [Rhodococcus opacus]ELB92175.1 hypothetical protein Rwratislav_15533 [Rhodococcus wratislaviensis IFP 2016]MDX5970014.1 hypothetical protein [Rhodococcus opacus]
MDDHDVERRFSRLSVEGRARLRADPYGPVPRDLVPRLEQLGLLPPDLQPPIGERTLPRDVSRYIETLAG